MIRYQTSDHLPYHSLGQFWLSLSLIFLSKPRPFVLLVQTITTRLYAMNMNLVDSYNAHWELGNLMSTSLKKYFWRIFSKNKLMIKTFVHYNIQDNNKIIIWWLYHAKKWEESEFTNFIFFTILASYI